MTSGTHDRDDRDLVFLYALQSLPPSEIPVVEAHISACADCRQELDTALAGALALSGCTAGTYGAYGYEYGDPHGYGEYYGYGGTSYPQQYGSSYPTGYS